MTIRQQVFILLAVLLGAALFAPSSEAQSLWDKVKKGVSNTAKETVNTARSTAMEEGMAQAGFVMLAEGGYAGTAAPWIVEEEAVAFAEMPGNGYVAANRLAQDEGEPCLRRAPIPRDGGLGDPQQLGRLGEVEPSEEPEFDHVGLARVHPGEFL